MENNLFIVKYSGPFGFIKPWTAVRDEEVYSQQFLTQSMIAGIERKLFPELLDAKWGIYKVKGHRINYQQVSIQQEQSQPRGWNKRKDAWERPHSILKRGVLVNPILFLAFETLNDARKAINQHICFARNEDILLPQELIETTKSEFQSNEELFNGFELVFENTEASFLVGYNRYDNFNEMYGWLRIVGKPVKSIF